MHNRDGLAASDHAPIIAVHGLTRKYGDLVAVDRIDFHVNRGEVFGFLGDSKSIQKVS